MIFTRPARHGVLPRSGFILITAFMFFALVVGGCSEKGEKATKSVKAPDEKAVTGVHKDSSAEAHKDAVTAAHAVPADAAHKKVAHMSAKAEAGAKLFKEGLALTLQGKYEKAIEKYKAAAKKNPDNAATYNNLGFAYYDTKNFDEAIKYQKKALAVDSDYAFAYLGLAIAYEKKGDKKNALANWQEFAKRGNHASMWYKKAMEHIKNLTMHQKQKTH